MISIFIFFFFPGKVAHQPVLSPPSFWSNNGDNSSLARFESNMKECNDLITALREKCDSTFTRIEVNRLIDSNRMNAELEALSSRLDVVEEAAAENQEGGLKTLEKLLETVRSSK